MASMYDKLKEALEDEKVVAMIKAKIERTARFKVRWEERFNNFLEALSESEVDELMQKFIEWEHKYHNMWLDRGVDTQSNILTILFDTAAEFGTEIECVEDFCVAKVEYLGYVFRLFVGQGSFIAISKDGERIF